MVRYESGQYLDLALFVLYPPPYPRLAKDRQRWQAAITKLFDWLSSEVGWLPERCTPIIGLDCSNGLGGTGTDRLVAEGIGDYNRGSQNYAGDRLREIMANYLLRAVNTFATGDRAMSRKPPTS